MKNIILILFVMLTTGIFAQQTKPKYKKIIPVYKEIQGENNTYIKEHFPHSYNMYNKNAKFRSEDSDYMYRDQIRIAWKYINISDRELLDSYVKTHITPWFKQYKGNFKRFESFNVQLYADMQGNILEVGVNCPKDIKLPVSAFEKFENDVLSGELRLITDTTTYPIFKNSKWVYQSIPYIPQDVRDMK